MFFSPQVFMCKLKIYMKQVKMLKMHAAEAHSQLCLDSWEGRLSDPIQFRGSSPPFLCGLNDQRPSPGSDLGRGAIDPSAEECDYKSWS